MLDVSTALAGLPAVLRAELFASYQEITKNYIESRWEPAELNGGKFCEVVYSVINGALTGKFPPKSTKPANMLAACRQLENIPPDAARVGDRSLRILIPRLLPVLYEIRNNRGVGHVGGDVNPNREDAEAVLGMASWIVAELTRIFHGISLSEAQRVVDALAERRHPLVWAYSENGKRVLDPTLGKAEQTLLLLYTEPAWVSVNLLFDWVEYSSLPLFKANVLKRLHGRREIEFDSKESRARITPRGATRVRKEILHAEGSSHHGATRSGD